MSGLPILPLIAALSLGLAGCAGKSSANDTSSTGSTGSTATGTSSTDAGATGTGADYDGDTILDLDEGTDDADADGLPNFQDDDSDGDTIKDFIEAGDSDLLTLPIDSDGDSTPDYLDLDSDNNCISDELEKNPTGTGPGDTDGDGVPDYADPDNDGDGISDIIEIGGSCAITDTDLDGTPDYMDTDSDNDGIGDIFEAGTNEYESNPVDTDGDGVPDYLDQDSDDDGISDADESGVSSVDQEPRDTDGDGSYDFADTDSDGDGLSDRDELYLYLTDPYDADTDGDGFSDGGEIAAGTDPLDDTSVIDGIYVEVGERTETEEQFDFDVQIQMGDIGFLVDTTCSMSGTASAMAGEFSQIVTQLALSIPDAEYAFSTFDDYAYAGYGSSSYGDKPFYLRKQITSSTSQVQTEMSAFEIHGGSDAPEASMEALVQASVGGGYDQNCNSVYDNSTDIRPFFASSDDPFGGLGGENWSASPPGGGDIGGMGFRDFALPIIVYASDTYMRDPENGYGTPNGCPADAGFSDVVSGMSDLGGYLIGICTNSTLCTPQMEDLAGATGSYADTDGDGVIDNPLVFEWSGSSEDFRSTIVQAIENLINSIQFDRVALEVVGDEWGFVTSIDPEAYDNVSELGAGSTTLSFTLNFRGVVAATTEDQLFGMTLNVIGDDTILLDTLDIIVVVPGTNY
ncbi:MAG: hypothetical protein GXP62_01320 [Oligoflexia bacterium]|nr:hypothetical protein [Oligoflexia bacterium]